MGLEGMNLFVQSAVRKLKHYGTFLSPNFLLRLWFRGKTSNYNMFVKISYCIAPDAKGKSTILYCGIKNLKGLVNVKDFNIYFLRQKKV